MSPRAAVSPCGFSASRGNHQGLAASAHFRGDVDFSGQGEGQWKPSGQLLQVAAPAQEAARRRSADRRILPRGGPVPATASQPVPPLPGHRGCREPPLPLVVNLTPGLHRPERTPPGLTVPPVCDVAASPRGPGRPHRCPKPLPVSGPRSWLPGP